MVPSRQREDVNPHDLRLDLLLLNFVGVELLEWVRPAM